MKLDDEFHMWRYMDCISISGYFSCGIGSIKRNLKDPLHLSSAILEHAF